MEAWKKKAWNFEDEIGQLRKEQEVSKSRWSVQAVEEERMARKEAERAREGLEERMKELRKSKKKKGGGLNCF